MAGEIANGKRIVKNTLINYFQVAISALIGLVTSRLVLQCLGVSDYGLYNVVGGLVAMFSFISNSMSGSTSRFLNFEMGNPNGNVNRIFNISNTLHMVTAFALFLIIEAIGVFYIHNYLNVAPGKEADAMFVFQVSTIVTCVGIMNVPYRAVMVAREQFATIAAIEISNSVIKLLLVLALTYYHGNALRLYAVMMCAGTALSFVAYHYICIRKWPHMVKWKLVNNLKAYKDQLNYSSWTLFLLAAVTGRSQGSHLLMNYFFGTAVNAAYAVSLTIQKYVEILASNFSKAANPQITQLVGSGEHKRAIEMVAKISRMHLLLMEITFFTLSIELDFLLQLWLGDNVPPETSVFCRLTLMVALVKSTDSGIGTLINAYGKIKWFKIIGSAWLLACLPLGYIAYYKGYPAYTILIFFIVADIFFRVSQLTLMKHIYGFDVRGFVIKAWLRPFIIFCLMCGFVSIYNYVDIFYTWIEKVLGILLISSLTMMLVFAIGLVKTEKKSVSQFVRKLI